MLVVGSPWLLLWRADYAKPMPIILETDGIGILAIYDHGEASSGQPISLAHHVLLSEKATGTSPINIKTRLADPIQHHVLCK